MLKLSQIYMYGHGPITLGPISISPNNWNRQFYLGSEGPPSSADQDCNGTNPKSSAT